MTNPKTKNLSTHLFALHLAILASSCVGTPRPVPDVVQSTVTPISRLETVTETHPPLPSSTPFTNQQDTEDDSIQPESVSGFPETANYKWETVASGLTKPLGVTHAGDGSARLFIVEQPGLIRVLQSGELLSTPFLDIRDRVGAGSNEQGLLGIAFHPNFQQNGLFFVNYTGKNWDTYISRFSVSSDPNLADPVSEVIILRFKQPYANHNGGHLLFGPDGNLYIGTGDGGSGGDPDGNAQNPESLLGKMLRIDVDHGNPYAVPADNPYAAGGGGRPEIWAVGLRNPWRYSFDKATGDLFIADVGQNQWEEVNFLSADPSGTLPPRANFGWNYFEAFHPFEGTPPTGITTIPPIWEYDHTHGCSITGGIVYRGTLDNWQGIYVYGDFCQGTIWGLLRDPGGNWQNSILFQTGSTITAFGEDEFGELYMVDRNGEIFQLVKSQ